MSNEFVVIDDIAFGIIVELNGDQDCFIVNEWEMDRVKEHYWQFVGGKVATVNNDKVTTLDDFLVSIRK